MIGAGGGGIPVVRTEAGDYQSVDAVIDKDLSTALLAREIHADILVITTGVEKVCIHFGKPQQQALDRVDIATMTRYMQEGHFPRQHVAKNHRQPDVPRTGRQRSDYHHAGMPACGATRRNGHPYY